MAMKAAPERATVTRELTLQELYAELLQIAARDYPTHPRFTTVLQHVRDDLKKQREWPIAGMETDCKRPLADWWAGFPGLSRYIKE